MLSGIRLVHDVPYTGSRRVDVVGAILSVLAMGGIVLGILVWQEGGESVVAVLAIGAAALVLLVYWLRRQKRQGKPTLLDPELFKSKVFESGVTGQMLQQVALGGTMIVLPIYLQMVLEYNALKAGLSLAPLSLTMFAVAIVAGRRVARRRPSSIIRLGFAILTIGLILLIPIVPRADSGWWLLVPLMIAGCGLGLLVSQLNNYTLAPISDERVSEAAGVNSAAGSFGLSFGLAFAGAIMLATLSLGFTSMATSSTVLSPAEQQQVSHALEADAQIMSNTQLKEQLASHPEKTQNEIIRINTSARHLALQVALLIPVPPAGSGCSTRSAWCAFPTPSLPAPPKAWSWADPGRAARGGRDLWCFCVPGYSCDRRIPRPPPWPARLCCGPDGAGAGGHYLHGDAGAHQQRGPQQLRGCRQLAEHYGGEQRRGEGFAQRQHRRLGGSDAPQASQEQPQPGGQPAAEYQHPGRGPPEPERGRIQAFLVRDPRHRPVQRERDGGPHDQGRPDCGRRPFSPGGSPETPASCRCPLHADDPPSFRRRRPASTLAGSCPRSQPRRPCARP